MLRGLSPDPCVKGPVRRRDEGEHPGDRLPGVHVVVHCREEISIRIVSGLAEARVPGTALLPRASGGPEALHAVPQPSVRGARLVEARRGVVKRRAVVGVQEEEPQLLRCRDLEGVL